MWEGLLAVRRAAATRGAVGARPPRLPSPRAAPRAPSRTGAAMAMAAVGRWQATGAGAARRAARAQRPRRARARAVEEFAGPDADESTPQLSPEAAGVVSAQAEASAAGLPTPGEADFRLLNDILESQDWETLQGKVRAAAVEGKLSEKTLAALHQVHTQAMGREGEDPRIAQSLQQVGQLLVATLGQMQMPPAMQLIDQLLQIDPNGGEEEIAKNLQAAFDTEQVSSEEAMLAVDGLLEMMEAQEADIDKAIQEGTAGENKEEFEDMLNMVKARQEAKIRLAGLKSIIKGVEAAA